MKTTITAAELATLLDEAPDGVRILSLDCFDTLIWRNVQAPEDVFADLKIDGGAGWMRKRAESRARKSARFAKGGTEVSIEEIYATLMPNAGADAIADAVRDELAAEARHCFAFAPTVALMRAAKARGLGVVIVSDTYLGEAQLRALIGATAGDDVLGLIDRVFCSSDHGVGKPAGLFKKVLPALGIAPEAVIHVGDNMLADLKAPAALGIHAVHFRQFDAGAEQRLRLEAAAMSVLDPQVRATIPVYQPHRPAVSLRTEADSAWALGHDVLGPVLHAFAGWVRDEAEALAARTGRPVKTIFLLRDGHLPSRVFEAVTGARGATAEISRFTARRAGFTDEAAVHDYLVGQARHERVEILARQLGLSKDEGRILGKGGQAKFEQAALTPATLRKIGKRAEAFADRLFAHLQAAGVARGDAVMFVDLGYNGTVQNHLAGFAKRFDLAIAGRYLLLREETLSGLDKKGFLDARHYDLRALHALSGPISAIEQMCTISQGSVVDYDPAGQPVRKAIGVKGAQSAVRDRIQDACVAYAEQAAAGFAGAPASDDADCRRRMAAGILARLLFMPSAEDVALFGAFEHDMNMGTDDMVRMLDLDESARGLRRRGLFYLNRAERMYLAAEIQPHGLPLNLSLFSANRFGLDLRNTDFQSMSLTLPVMLADARGQVAIEVQAHATHDGFYLATIPVGAGRFSVGVHFGALCDWVEIEECAFHPVEAFSSEARELHVRTIEAQTIYEGMTEEGPGFYRCSTEALFFAPPPVGVTTPHVLAVAFRPRLRGAGGIARRAAA